MTWSRTHSLPPKFPAVPPPAPFAPNKNWTDIYQTCQAHSSTGHFLSYFVAVTYLTQMLGLCCELCSHLCADITPLRGPPSPTSPPKATALHVTLSSTLPFPNLSTTGHFTLHCYSVGDLHVCQCTNTQAAWGRELDLFCSSEYPQCW